MTKLKVSNASKNTLSASEEVISLENATDLRKYLGLRMEALEPNEEEREERRDGGTDALYM